MTSKLEHAAVRLLAAPDDTAARLGLFEALAESECILMLDHEPDGAQLSPTVFALEGGSVVLAFDSDDKLAGFAGRPVPYAALSGRALAGMLAASGTGLGLNLGSDAELLLSAAELRWFAELLDQRATEHLRRPVRFGPPALAAGAVAALTRKLAGAPGLAERALLAGAEFEDGDSGAFLAIVGARPGAEPALAGAINEALAFNGDAAPTLDIAYLDPADPLLAPLMDAAHVIDIPAPVAAPAKVASPAARGMDPDKPPRLR